MDATFKDNGVLTAIEAAMDERVKAAQNAAMAAGRMIGRDDENGRDWEFATRCRQSSNLTRLSAKR
jgi:hypothetical protein